LLVVVAVYDRRKLNLIRFQQRSQTAATFVKTKTPLPGWQWGSINLVIKSEPNRRAGKQQRVQQQVQI